MDIKNIEHGIPIPPVKKRGRDEDSLAGAMRKMQVGDSIVIDKSQRTYAYASGRNAGFHVAVRVIEGDKIRVWRKA